MLNSAKGKSGLSVSSKKPIKVSVIIPFRNEEMNLGRLLESLETIDYPKEYLQFVFVDDGSEDTSASLLEEWLKNNPHEPASLIRLSKPSGKKFALNLGITNAHFDVLVQTDADCVLYPDWIKEMTGAFASGETKVVIGAVKMIDRGSFWTKLMALEFASLQASGLALASLSRPIMANGANMSYRKATWLKHQQIGQKWKSGDDVFLVQSASLAESKSVVVQFDSLVDTMVPNSVMEFVSQRVRWGGKTAGYPMKLGKYIAALIVLISFFQVLLLLFGIVELKYVLLYASFTIVKTTLDFRFLKPYLINRKQNHLIVYIPVLALIYPFYILYTAVLIVFASKKLKWKGHPLKS